MECPESVGWLVRQVSAIAVRRKAAQWIAVGIAPGRDRNTVDTGKVVIRYCGLAVRAEDALTDSKVGAGWREITGELVGHKDRRHVMQTKPLRDERADTDKSSESDCEGRERTS